MTAEKVNQSKQQWEISREQVLFIITDNGSNMVKAVRTMNMQSAVSEDSSDHFYYCHFLSLCEVYKVRTETKLSFALLSSLITTSCKGADEQSKLRRGSGYSKNSCQENTEFPSCSREVAVSCWKRSCNGLFNVVEQYIGHAEEQRIDNM